MPNRRLAEQLIATLPSGREGLFNPWRDNCPHQAPDDGPDARLERLSDHLDCAADYILIGEAAGYQGCRYSGISFTSERLLGECTIPRIGPLRGRLSTRRLPFSEPSATIVWRALYKLSIEHRTVLWNALQMHPHAPDNVWSNRTPDDDELALGEAAVRLLVEAFPEARVVAVGDKAKLLLTNIGIDIAGKVRHPANGGATKFANGLAEIVAAT